MLHSDSLYAINMTMGSQVDAHVHVSRLTTRSSATSDRCGGGCSPTHGSLCRVDCLEVECFTDVQQPPKVDFLVKIYKKAPSPGSSAKLPCGG